MKRFVVFCLLALGCSLSFGDEGRRDRKPKHRPEVPKAAVERPMSFVDRLMTLDKDGDGKLSRKELEAFKPPVRPMPGPPKFDPSKFGPPRGGPGFNPWQMPRR